MSQPVRCLGMVVSLVLLGHAHAQQVGDAYDNGTQVRIGQYGTQSTLPTVGRRSALRLCSTPLSAPRCSDHWRRDYRMLPACWPWVPINQWRCRLSCAFRQSRSVPWARSRVRDVLQVLVGTITWGYGVKDPIQRRLWLLPKFCRLVIPNKS